MASTRRAVARGETLFVHGAPFTAFYAIRSGAFKTRVTTEDGREQIVGFQMAGDLLGFDGIDGNTHRSDAVALQDAEVCAVPYDTLEETSRNVPGIALPILRAMSREIVHDHDLMLLLGGLCADARVATFLCTLAKRQGARGLSRTTLQLPMTRQEIGTYLGIKLETVSRCLSRLHDAGVLDVRLRCIGILQPEALQMVAGAAGH